METVISESSSSVPMKNWLLFEADTYSLHPRLRTNTREKQKSREKSSSDILHDAVSA